MRHFQEDAGSLIRIKATMPRMSELGAVVRSRDAGDGGTPRRRAFWWRVSAELTADLLLLVFGIGIFAMFCMLTAK
jgi:hypothetical protein